MICQRQIMIISMRHIILILTDDDDYSRTILQVHGLIWISYLYLFTFSLDLLSYSLVCLLACLQVPICQLVFFE